MASNPGSKPPRNDCTTTCWRLRSPTSSPGSPGRFSTRDAPSSASRQRRQRPDLPDPRAVLGAVKAQPGSGRARRQDSTTAGLDGPCARRVCARRPGRRNDRQARTKEQREVRSYRWRNQHPLPAEVCERMRQRWRIGLPGDANTGDPNGPFEACPLIRSSAR